MNHTGVRAGRSPRYARSSGESVRVGAVATGSSCHVRLAGRLGRLLDQRAGLDLGHLGLPRRLPCPLDRGPVAQVRLVPGCPQPAEVLLLPLQLGVPAVAQPPHPPELVLGQLPALVGAEGRAGQLRLTLAVAVAEVLRLPAGLVLVPAGRLVVGPPRLL